ncbi:MAG: T9SS type A sorting domain-containing protein, partial [Bacteroidia bacterium]|nr:T9SS type A sorting domain-containing protein [Bacteroidia bacterium]
EATCGYFHMNSGVYKKPVFLTSTGAATSSSTYGNHFEDSLTITNNGAVYFNMGSSGEDIYDGPVILYNYSSKEIRLAATDTSYFNNHVTVNASSGGVEFGASGGVSILASGKTISVGTFSSSYLTLTKFIQLGSSAQTLTLSGTGVVSLEGCIFNGNLTINAPGILTKSSIYYGTTSLNRTGSTTNFHSYGSNVYAGNVTWDNAGSGGRVRLASTAPDTYMGHATFSSTGGQDLQVAYVGDNAFAGNITINSNKVVFNTSTGKVTFTGTSNQTLNGSYNYPFKKMAINKSTGTVTANTTLSVDDSLIFIQGNLITTSTNLLTLKHGSKANGASNSSFVNGPVKKVGNTAFEFPIGKYSIFSPLSITATSSSANAYSAEYFDQPQTHGANRDSTLGGIAYCNYWNLDRVTGSAKVAISIGWNQTHCGLMDSTSATVAFWDSEWKNLKVNSFNGNITAGNLLSLDSLNITSSNISIAYRIIPVTLTPLDLTVTLSISSVGMDHYFGLNGTNTLSDGTSWDNSTMCLSVAKMQPSTMRFPGGATGNWWDWRKGWFVDRNFPFLGCRGLPSEYEYLIPQNNNLENFSIALGEIGSRPLFMLNMLTSDLPYQTAMLHQAEILGMPIEQVELGNEFYRDADVECEYSEIFPTAADYVTVSQYWTEKIKERFSTEIAFTGADSRDNSGRQDTWNVNLNLSSLTTNIPDAATIHAYKGSEISGGSDCEWIDYTFINSNTSNADKLFESAFDYMNGTSLTTGISNVEWPDLDNQNLWMTEYNLFDRHDNFIHGSWAHALHTAAMTFAMLEHDFVTKVNCHTMVGNAIFSSFFNDINNGFVFSNDPSNPSSEFCSVQEEIANIPTGNYSVTSLGYAMSEIGQALRFATARRELTFDAGMNTLPTLGSTPAVKGWIFTDADGNEQIVVLNLSPQEITIDFDSPSGFEEPQQMKVLNLFNPSSPGLERLNRFVYDDDGGIIYYVEIDNSGNAGIGSIANPTFNSYNGNNVIPGFSIVRYTYFDQGINSVTISASENAVCQGRPFYLYANAGPNAVSFDWKYNGNSIGTSTTPSFLTSEQGTSNYSVVVTYSPSGSAASLNPLSITQKSIQTLTVPSSPIQFCKNSAPITISASLSGSNTNYYCWIPGEGETIASGLESQLTDHIEVAPEHTTTYTVYATDGLCSVREDITIEVIGDIQFAHNPEVYCSSGTGVTLDPQLTGSYNYLWSPGSSTGSTLTVNPTTPQTYSVTVTSTSGTSCTVTGSVDVIPVECCTPSVDVTLAGYSNAQELVDEAILNDPGSHTTDPFTGVDILTGIDIYVEGELLIDKDLILNNVQIQFAERSTIVVDSYRSLRLNACNFDACSSLMWKGIEVKEKGKLYTNNIASDECEIANAYYGVYFNPRSYGLLRRTRFLNTFTGIYSLGSPASLMTSYPKILSRCYFESTSTLLPVYGNLPNLPANGNNGYAGIDAENDLIGLTSISVTNPSYFLNLSNGIVAKNSILTVSNTFFEDIHPEANYNWLVLQGNGIYTFGTDKWASLSITGLLNSSNPTFSNCDDGIETYRGAVTVSNALFNSTERAISVLASAGQPTTLLGNTINASVRGIDMMFMDFAGRIRIEGNEINMDNSTSANGVRGISLDNFDFMSTPAQSKIACNVINLDNAETGIHVGSVNQNMTPAQFNLAVSDNTIAATDNSVFADGISFSNATNFTAIGNSVSGDGSTTSANSFRFMMSPEGVIHNNYSTGTHRGFFFQNYSPSIVKFRNNTMDVNWHGLELNPTAIIGIQSFASNNWTGYNLGTFPYEVVNGSAVGAFNFNLTFDGLNLNKFTVDIHTFGTVRYPFYEPPSGTLGLDWFQSSSGTEGVPFYTQCNVSREMDAALSEIDSLVVIDSIGAVTYETELREIAKSNLYDKLKIISEISTLSTYYNDFISDYLSNSSGRMLTMRDYLTDELNFDSAQLIANAFSDSLLLNVINETVLSMAENEDYGLNDTLKLFWENLKTPLDTTTAVYDLKIIDAIEAIFETLEFEDVNTIIESNLQISYLGAFTLMIQENIGDVLLAQLAEVAAQCPESGGRGVFIARSVLNSHGYKNSYNDEMLCYPTMRISNEHQSKSNPVGVEIKCIPNPNTGSFMIYSNSIDIVNCKIIVTNVMGTTLDFVKANSNKNAVSLTLKKTAPGIYLIRVYDPVSGAIQTAEPLIILNE